MKQFDAIIKTALKEDGARGDVTTAIFIPKKLKFEGEMFAKRGGILCGGSLAARAFELADPGAKVRVLMKDGARMRHGSVILKVRGSRNILSAERTALNFVQHLSGIATLAGAFASRIRNKRTRIYDTRKTIPGLRALAKYAVKCGGGANHRMGLDDAFLIKDNHIAMLGGSIERLRERLAAARRKYPRLKVEIEAQSLAQVKAFLPLGFDIIMLDNMGRADMRKAIKMIRSVKGRRTEIEISGGVNLQAVSGLSALDADRISVGAITNSAPSLDIAFDARAVNKENA